MTYFFPVYLSVCRTVCHLADTDGVDEQETQSERSTDRNFPVASVHKQTCEKAMKRFLDSQKVELLRIMTCYDVSIHAAC